MKQTERLREELLEKVRLFYQAQAAEHTAFVPGESKISYAARVFDDKEMVSLVDASLDFWLTAGRFAETFEKQLARFLSIAHCSLCNSGSSANLLAFMALTSPELGERRIGKGDEVITVAAGFPTTITPIIHYGAVPVFVDVSLPTYNIDVSQLESARSEQTKAVMLAHTLGNPFDVGAIKAFCEQYNLWLIEDNCDALGSRYDGCYTGAFGDLGTSSFYPPHHITMGEGGAVYTQNKLLQRLVNSFRDWGRDCWCPPGRDDSCEKRFTGQFGDLPKGFDHKFVYSHFGYNLKVTDMQAAVGCAQLEKLPAFILARRNNFKQLREKLKHLEGPLLFAEPTLKSDPAWFGFVITVAEDAGFTRNDLAAHLEANKVQTRNLFAGNILKHPCFAQLEAGRDFRIAGNLTQTDRIMHQTLWIGVYPGMTPEMITYMVQTISDFVGKRCTGL
ncbi:lipopolysaccharide biosynthesis protein RfbH [bacterium]|nr:lipopolysaccharide biosynthesis protein RfbH [bacterium]